MCKMNSVSQRLSGPTILVTYYIRKFSDPTQDLLSQDSGVDPVICVATRLWYMLKKCVLVWPRVWNKNYSAWRTLQIYSLL